MCENWDRVLRWQSMGARVASGMEDLSTSSLGALQRLDTVTITPCLTSSGNLRALPIGSILTRVNRRHVQTSLDG